MFKFCPRCSHKLTKKTKNLYICSDCGFRLYENPRATTAVILENEKGEVLLIKRRVAPKIGYWDSPGGFIDIEETLEDGVKREIKEELGFALQTFEYIGSYAGRYLYKGINYYTLCFSFKAKLGKSKIEPNDEIAELRFFPPRKIPLKQVAFIEVRKTLQDYLSSLQQSNNPK